MLTNLTGPTMAKAHPAVAASSFSAMERMAIGVGILDGETALNRSRILGFIPLFAKARSRPLANKSLEALRAYAELARTLLPRSVSTTTLADAGFSALQIRELSRMIARAPASHAPVGSEAK